MNPTQINFQDFAKGLGVDPSSNEPKTPAWSDKLQSLYETPVATAPQPAPSYGAEVGQEQVAGAQKLFSSISKIPEAGPKIAEDFRSGKPFSALGEAGKATLQTGLGSITGATRMVAAPITPAISKLLSYTDSQLAKNNPKAADAVKQITTKVSDLSNKYPEETELASDIINSLLLVVGGPKVAPAIKTGGEAISETVAPVVKGTISKGEEAISGAKNLIKPEPVESTIGKVLQGGESDISKGKKGLSLIDTSKVKTYKDLTDVSNETVKKTLKEQDAVYAKDTTPKKVQQLAIKVGDQEAAHNYVIDAVNQLKSYYSKINDVAKLNKVNNYAQKLDPVKGKGLTLNEISDISRMHGTDLNAYNASGELASGLSKQAAENTRQGVKETLGNLSPEGRAIDEKLSSIITVRNLSKDMADKVTTLTQRLQKPNILQKIGGSIGRATRITGVGDFAQKLLGFEKVPGASTLNAVEIEAKLAKNLAKIKEVLSKDDAGFVKDISEMIKSNQ